jgi:DNA replication protein DnaC
LLTHPTLDQLRALGLDGMLKACGEIEAASENAALTHLEWLGLLLDHEISHRRDKRLIARLRYARQRHQACIEDVDYRASRGLDRILFLKLAQGSFVDEHDNVVICGPTGVGKSWLACALGHQACRHNRSVLYQRIPKLFTDLALARGDGRYARLMRALGGVQLLLAPLDAAARHDLLEVLEARYGRRSTVITSQVPMPTPSSIASCTMLIASTSPATACAKSARPSPPPQLAQPHREGVHDRAAAAHPVDLWTTRKERRPQTHRPAKTTSTQSTSDRPHDASDRYP